MKVNKVILAKPRGFCAGVDRAIDVVNRALELYEHPIYVRREIVHNSHVIDQLRSKGAIFVDEVDEAPDGSTLIFSAHGIAPEVRARAAAKSLRVIDATCPLVTKVHLEAIRFARQDASIILIGHEGHDEVVGTMGELPGRIHLVGSVEEAEKVEVGNPSTVAVITQTTLSVDDTQTILEVLKRRFPGLRTPPSDDICYATQNRQTAVKTLSERAGVVLVLGSANSSNSNRLREVARAAGCPAYLINDSSHIDPAWFEGVETVAITAGASTPENLVEDVVNFFRARGVKTVEEAEIVPENVTFTLPFELQRDMAARKLD
ncbi:MAG TPA: 4-hydroxy-3-methylbut-2-enyl diphosphate reductase [Terriglobia bacterium]|nr:4-hydroxy-3-methylbut-2-enyl diphosphate reductase [Terriglobia bacterium]